jgi:hypothetical protein
LKFIKFHFRSNDADVMINLEDISYVSQVFRHSTNIEEGSLIRMRHGGDLRIRESFFQVMGIIYSALQDEAG